MKADFFSLLYVANSSFPSNSANSIQIINMCEAFNSVFKEVKLLSFISDKEEVINRYNVLNKFDLVDVGGKSKYYLLNDLKLFFYLVRNNSFLDDFQIIFSRSLIFSTLISFFYKGKIIYEVHDDTNVSFIKSIIKNLFRSILTKRDVLIIFTNDYLKDDFLKYKFNCDVLTIENGVYLKKFTDIDNYDRDILRDKYGVPNNKKVVTYIGGFQEWKGVKEILKCADKINNENIFFLMVGGKISSKRSNIKYLERISQKEVLEVYSLSDILLIPNSSRFECSNRTTSPLKLFEYMASKKPIIASAVPSIKKIVSSREVLFFQPDDYIDLIKKIEFLILDIDLQRKMVKNSSELVKSYSYPDRVKRIINFLSQIK